jgi:predicted alpha/beta hydrolase family esterase
VKTIILPGYSSHNKDWVYKISSKLNLGHKVHVIEWDHWESRVNFSLKKEIEKIRKIIGEQEVNIIAKSVGVAVALELVPSIAKQVNKLILCGIASVVKEDRRLLLTNIISTVPVEKILCIQNENDKYVPFKEAEAFYHSVNKNIKVVSKQRNDHEYPYPEDFQNFLQT